MSEKTLIPEVLWAQRSSKTDADKNHVFLTLMVPDVSKDDKTLDLTETKLSFKGFSKTKNVTYAVELEFFGEIDPKSSKIHHTDRDIELVLQKKDLKEEYWPRLLKEAKKQHFLKTDFDKWVDEDEQDTLAEDDDYMSKMNSMGDSGFGGIDFSKLGGGAGGFPGAGGMGDEDEDEDEDDDEEMPELSGDDSAADLSAAVKDDAAPKKVEEIE